MKGFLVFLCCIVTAFVFVSDVSAQVVNIGQSSEWEATGFNNGRRIVRESCDGQRLHYVWHSKKDPNEKPTGTDCDIFYACTKISGSIIIPPVNLTENLNFGDNRYPSIAIEYHPLSRSSSWQKYNAIHLVWQAKKGCSGIYYYNVYHARIPITCNSSVPPQPLTWTDVSDLSGSDDRDSLVPAIAINAYDSSPDKQHIHVVWQEEDIHPSTLASDILYTRSIDSGAIFKDPNSIRPWANITDTKENSQVPSISCSLDTYYGNPLDYSGRDYAYKCDEVHVSYNEETNSLIGTNIFYLRSPDDGYNWQRPYNVTLATGGSVHTGDGYSCIVADMEKYVHIVFMRDVIAHEPAPGFLPGYDPTNPASFPGPNPGMYNVLTNQIVYWYSDSNTPGPISWPANIDSEFPTVALDREQNITVNWQSYIGYSRPNYEIYRIGAYNASSPSWPPQVPNFNGWTGVYKDSSDSANDDLFPNLAHKKAAMFKFPSSPYIPGPGFTEIWTAVDGLGYSAAMSNLAKTIKMLSNMY